ncbi:hypothetical protein SAMN04487910_4493 [Aquimarina amphilecti]|uniref:Uncharacterized protein n=1 Tax=Aquimarina amphilecti TaxID=1038014 RepID=A0A1H7WQJ1_AQUAM|nr:hypothetical protein [Aquimarina amphilecti]SEM23227.1 hypothetical protein SAMN04487910_4493 [Aquimarina amphilecti]
MGTFSLIFVHLLELIAAIFGTFYIFKYREDKSTRYFTYFLWLTVFVETVGLIPNIIQSVESFGHLKETFWNQNFWLYNTYLILSFLFYLNYVKMNLKSSKLKKVLMIFFLIYGLSTIVNLVFSKVLFEAYSAYSFVVGSILLFFSIGLYYYEILQSNAILNFSRSIPFYFSVGTLVFHLCVTPLFIYSRYYSNRTSPEFVEVYALILTIANIFMYTCYIIGFLICSKKNKSYS